MKIPRDKQNKLFRKGLKAIKRECKQMKKLYDADIDRPECDLAWLKAYDRWLKWSKLAKAEDEDYGITPPVKPPFYWNDVLKENYFKFEPELGRYETNNPF